MFARSFTSLATIVNGVARSPSSSTFLRPITMLSGNILKNNNNNNNMYLPNTLSIFSNGSTSSTSKTVTPWVHQIVVRYARGWAFTKQRIKRMARKKRRQKMLAMGIPIPKPPKYIAVDTPVINAIAPEVKKAEIAAHDALVAQEMSVKLQEVQKKEILRYGMEGLTMSDKVRKLFDLHNGNQKEVIKAQKMRGMEVFQLRDGDTGSSSVQVIALTTRIQQMQTHLTMHRKDKHNKRNLERMIVRRRKVLDYMERKDFNSYRRVVKTLGLAR